MSTETAPPPPSIFRREAIEFAASRLSGDVMLAMPVRLRVYLALIITTFVVGLGYLSLTSYARGEEVRGWVVPEGGIIRVSARTSGSVEQVFVHEGDTVKAGQALARIQLSTALETGENTGSATNAALTSEIRATAQSSLAMRTKLLAEQESLGPKLAELNAQLGQIRQQIRFQQQQVTIAEADYERFRQLAATKVIAVRLADERRSALLSAQANLSQLRGSALGMEQAILDASTRLRAIPSDIEEVDANARSADAEIHEKSIANESQSIDLIVATINGRVLTIPVEVGQNVSSGTTVAIIAPSGARMDAELYAPSSSIGFVHTGQQVRVMYQAFPYERFGTAQGQVVSISSTILSPAEVQMPGANLTQPVFRVRVRLQDQGVHAFGRYVPLQSGMLLTARMVVDQGTLFEWLLGPVFAASS